MGGFLKKLSDQTAGESQKKSRKRRNARKRQRATGRDIWQNMSPQDRKDAVERLGKSHIKKKLAREQIAKEDELLLGDLPLLMPDEENLQRSMRRKLAARKGGRASTILSGRLGGAGGASASSSGGGGRTTSPPTTNKRAPRDYR